MADFNRDYPSLAGDLRLPSLFPQERYFSSVLRLGSAGVQLWTHYDVSHASEYLTRALAIFHKLANFKFPEWLNTDIISSSPHSNNEVAKVPAD